MRELTSHKVDGLNEALRIEAIDEPGPGGACHHYLISTRAKPLRDELRQPAVNCEVIFQHGPILESGVNGLSNESLLAIVEDRLAGFQSGPFACDTNQIALTHVRLAMDALKARTRDRVVRGVEGTNQQ